MAFNMVYLQILTLINVVTISLGVNALSCPSDQTFVRSPYVFSTGKYADCPALIGAIVDWYNDDYRSECQRWMGGSKPRQVENAYATECAQYSNGTIRYRADICCPGELREKRCFTCTNDTSHYSCNYHGTVETCSSGEECGTVFNYYGYGGNYCSRKISKGCMAADACKSLTDNFATTCVRYLDKPQCGFCHPGVTLGNRETTNSYSYSYCGARKVDACRTYPCRYGYCRLNDTLTRGYYCECYAYSWLNSDGHCIENICSHVKPCQNSGRCSHQSNAPGYTCCCVVGYNGRNCTEVVQPGCASNPGHCLNGGTCYDYGSNDRRCICPSGWVGERCENSGSLTCTTKEVTTTSYTSRYSYRNCSSYKRSDSSVISSCRYPMNPGGPYFENGVHGEVSTVKLNILSECVSETNCNYMRYTAKSCCPSCLSAPCQNGGWCVQKENTDYVCKCRFGFEGKNCQNKVALCMTAGDPHYRTFDEKMFHFQGTCKYIMTAPSQDYPGLDYFRVITKNEHRNNNDKVSYPKYIEVEVFGFTVRMDHNKVVKVDGAIVDLEANYPGFSLTYNGQYIRLETNFSLVVEFDGYWTGLIKLPAVYKDKVGGLCGNYDGDANNDLVTSGGKDVTTSTTQGSDIGNSWYESDPEDPACPKLDITDPTCNPSDRALAESDNHCGLIKSSTGPFSACASAQPTIAQAFFENCVYDTCANPVKESSCAGIEAFIAQCSNKGFGPSTSWRADTGCTLICRAGMKYVPLTSACHMTCRNPLAETECGLPNTEACKCPQGQVHHQMGCQSPSVCGCVDDDGKKYIIGSNWISKDCTERYSCDLSSTGWGELSESVHNCQSYEDCRVENGQGKCTNKVVNGQWGAWTGWSDCTQPCGQGLQTRDRLCDNPAPASGGQDCPGNSRDQRNCVCQGFSYDDDCQRCDLTVNPAGYLADPCSCTQFYQCVMVDGLWVTAHHRPCAPCTRWEQSVLTCVNDESVVDRSACGDPIVSETVLRNGGSPTCTRGADTCQKFPRDNTKYLQLVFGTWMKRDCPSGTTFKTKACQCTVGGSSQDSSKVFCLNMNNGFETKGGIYISPRNVGRVVSTGRGYVASFNGVDSRIEVPFFTNNEIPAFTFSLWYQRSQNSMQTQGLVYNGDCVQDGSLQILSVGYNQVKAVIRTNEKVSILAQATGGKWHHVVVTYDGSKMSLYIDGTLKSTDQSPSGHVAAIHCPLVLGSSYDSGYFAGLMDDICYYNTALTSGDVNKLYSNSLKTNQA